MFTSVAAAAATTELEESAATVQATPILASWLKKRVAFFNGFDEESKK